MKKPKFIRLILKSLIATLLALVLATIISGKLSSLQAADLPVQVKVKGQRNVRLYRSNGKRSRYVAVKGKKYTCKAKKYLKIKKKKILAYRIGNQAQWLLSKNAQIVKEKKFYQKATLHLPAAYTKEALRAAYQGKPSIEFIQAAMTGMNDNTFSQTNFPEKESDDKVILDLRHLTKAQNAQLSEFSLRLINEARADLELPAWIYSSGVQKLADDIASQYSMNKQSVKNGHYILGIVTACQENGLNLTDNYVEDMAGFYNEKSKFSLTEIKKNIYFGLKQMIFGFVGSGEQQRFTKSYYQEWEHAGDLFNTQGSSHDGDYDYYGFSISKTGNTYSMHYINVPSFIVNSQVYNLSFRP